MAEERVPAGWYPDPSGLPQLRWWDNHKWTEFVSDSQVEETVEEAAAEPAVAATVETVTLTRSESRAAIEGATGARTASTHAATDLGSAFDAVFGGTTLAAATPASADSATPPLAAAFDAAFGPAAGEPRFEEPRFVDDARRDEPWVEDPAAAIREAPLSDRRPAADPLETMFASSATSPVGVGTGETIGEALMRALRAA